MKNGIIDIVNLKNGSTDINKVYNGTTLVWEKNGFDPDALSYITAVETADEEALETNVKTAINNFVIELKTEALWDELQQVVIMAGARTLEGALIPLKGPTPTNNGFILTDYNRITGLKGNGNGAVTNPSGKWINSNLLNSSINDFIHGSTWITETTTVNASASFGSGFNVTNQKIITIAQDTVGDFYRIKGSTTFNNAVPLATGFTGITRIDNTTVTFFKNNVSTNVTNSVGTIDINDNVIIFGRGSTSNPNSRSNQRLRHWSLGSNLDLVKLQTAFTNLYNVYNTI